VIFAAASTTSPYLTPPRRERHEHLDRDRSELAARPTRWSRGTSQGPREPAPDARTFAQELEQVRAQSGQATVAFTPPHPIPPPNAAFKPDPRAAAAAAPAWFGPGSETISAEPAPLHDPRRPDPEVVPRHNRTPAGCGAYRHGMTGLHEPAVPQSDGKGRQTRSMAGATGRSTTVDVLCLAEVESPGWFSGLSTSRSSSRVSADQVAVATGNRCSSRCSSVSCH